MEEKLKINNMINYFSRFGGMWLDSSNFLSDLFDKISRGEITEQDAVKILEFSINGYVIFNKLVSDDLCDKFASY